MSADDLSESIAWPSFVDFLSTFIFVLLIFIGSLLFLMNQGVAESHFEVEAPALAAALTRQGYHPVQGRLKITVPLGTALQFQTGCPGANGCPPDLPEEAKEKLTQLANSLAPWSAGVTQITIRGQADSTRFQNDPYDLQNFELSNRRAFTVFRYLKECNGCSAAFTKALSQKLVLAGIGDRTSPENAPARAQDRTVVLIIEYGATQ